jgi:hypothetical protein
MARRQFAATRPSHGRTPSQKPLYIAVDHGRPILVKQTDFAPASRGGSWGTFAESFVRLNERALRDLDVAPNLVARHPEPTIQLTPGGRAGAIPLRSAQTGSVVAGLIVKPRFGWSGVGEVMSETGWSASPTFLELPLVPGSARQVPPWVLAGPILFRLKALLATVAPGYSMREEVRQTPRGQVLWPRYITQCLTRGTWQRLPCRFPDLSVDPIIQRNIRWAVERVRSELVRVGEGEPLGAALVLLTSRLLEQLSDVKPLRPRTEQLDRFASTRVLVDTGLKQGLQALGWVADERGLGGGQERDGLSWQLPLELLWERYVEAKIRDEVSREGGKMAVGRLGQTVFPLQWSTATARSVTHLVPDIVIRRGRSVRVVDAKYKAHFAELDEHAWVRLTDEMRDSHRADVHQVLAYASLYDADEVTASLIYPLRRTTWDGLRERRRDCAHAELYHGNRRIKLELRGLPFGIRTLP